MAKKPLTEEQRAELRARLARGREAKREKREAEEAAALKAVTLEDVEQDTSAADARRARLLEGVDPEIAKLITDAELDLIEREEREKAENERKAKALANIRGHLRQRARVESDLISPDVLRSDEEKRRLAEPVTFRVRLPNDGAGKAETAGFRVDGVLYQQDGTYTRPRAIFESLFANHYQAWLKEIQFRMLDQHKPGQSAREIIGNYIPAFEVVR